MNLRYAAWSRVGLVVRGAGNRLRPCDVLKGTQEDKRGGISDACKLSQASP
jgi:hypothetical protein